MSDIRDFVIEDGMLKKYTGNDAEVVIPEGVTSIGYSAFYECTNLTIHAPAGSYAEKYAKENKIKFIAE